MEPLDQKQNFGKLNIWQKIQENFQAFKLKLAETKWCVFGKYSHFMLRILFYKHTILKCLIIKYVDKNNKICGLNDKNLRKLII